MGYLLLKLVDSGYIVSFNQRAIAAPTREFLAAIGDIVVGWAVGCRSELFKELEVCESGRVDS